MLLEAGGPEERQFQWTSSAPVYVTLDGARVTYMGRHFDAGRPAAGPSSYRCWNLQRNRPNVQTPTIERETPIRMFPATARRSSLGSPYS